MIQGAYLSSLVKSGNNSWDIADIEFAAVGGGDWCENRENLGQCLNGGGGVKPPQKCPNFNLVVLKTEGGGLFFSSKISVIW